MLTDVQGYLCKVTNHLPLTCEDVMFFFSTGLISFCFKEGMSTNIRSMG
jgi:hypothetical protein